MMNEKTQHKIAIDRAREELFLAEMSDSIGAYKNIREAENKLRRLKKEYYEQYNEVV